MMMIMKNHLLTLTTPGVDLEDLNRRIGLAQLFLTSSLFNVC